MAQAEILAVVKLIFCVPVEGNFGFRAQFVLITALLGSGRKHQKHHDHIQSWSRALKSCAVVWLSYYYYLYKYTF